MLYESDKLRNLKLLRYYNICGEGGVQIEWVLQEFKA